MSEPKYPYINVELIGQDGNAFSILGRVRKALKQGGVSSDEIEKFQIEATSGDYDHLLQVVMQWVNSDSEEESENDLDDYDNGYEDNWDEDEESDEIDNDFDPEIP